MQSFLQMNEDTCDRAMNISIVDHVLCFWKLKIALNKF
jgi:hypothetical protein